MAGVIIGFFTFLLIRYFYRRFRKDERNKQLALRRKMEEAKKQHKMGRKKKPKSKSNSKSSSKTAPLLETNENYEPSPKTQQPTKVPLN